jgi:hypothetical protein
VIGGAELVDLGAEFVEAALLVRDRMVEDVHGAAGVGDLGGVAPSVEGPVVAVEKGLGGGEAAVIVGLLGAEAPMRELELPETPRGLGAGAVVAFDGAAKVVFGFEEFPDVEPRDRASVLRSPEAHGGGGEFGAADGGGGVDPVLGEGVGEDVAGGAGAVGDDEDFVRVAAAGHGDVDAADVAGAVEDEEGSVDGAALGGAAGLGVGQPDVLSQVRRRQADYPGAAGDSDRAVAVQVGDGPGVAVLDHQAAVGVELPVVATRRDPVTDPEVVGPGGERPLAEFAGCEPGVLRQVVEPHDRVVRWCEQGHGLAVAAGGLPAADRPPLRGGAAAFMDPVVGRVVVEDGDIAGAETQAGVAFPAVGEPVDVVELDGAARVDELPEHAAAADRGELPRIPDEDYPPVVMVGEGGELRQMRCRRHPGLVDDHGGPGRQPVARSGWPGAGVFVEELVERVRRHPGLFGQDLGGRRRGGHAEHRPAVALQVRGRGRQGGGLAGPGRAHDQHEPFGAGDRGGGVNLAGGQLDRRTGDRLRLPDAAGVPAALRPLEEPALLGQDLGGGQRPIGRPLGDRPAVPPQPGPVGDGSGDIDHLLARGTFGGRLDLLDDRVGGHPDRVERGGDLADDLGRPPRRLAFPQRRHRPIHRQVDCHREPEVDLVGGRPRQPFGCPADGGQLVSPQVVECRRVLGRALGWAALDDGFALEPPPLPRRGLATERVEEPVELLVEAAADIPGAHREVLEHPVGDPGDLRDAVLPVPPPGPEPRRELRAQAGVVERRGGPLVDLDRPGVQCQPPAVIGADPVGDHHMGVNLRVERA